MGQLLVVVGGGPAGIGRFPLLARLPALGRRRVALGPGGSGAPGAPRRLTTARGYDAEASWSPDGRWIVFASNRHAHAAGSGVDREALERDPAHFVDLYLMDSNGKRVRRLTDTPGYDGGRSSSGANR